MKILLSYVRREMRGRMSGIGIFLCCLALGVASIAAVNMLSAGLTGSLARDGQRLLGGDLAIRSNYAPPPPDVARALAQIAPQHTQVAELRAMALVPGSERAALIEIKAIDAAFPLYGVLRLENAAGQSVVLSSGQIAVERDLLSRLEIALGDSLSIGEKTFAIAATIAAEPDRIAGVGFQLAPRVIMTLPDFEVTGLAGEGSQISYDYRLKRAENMTAESLRQKVEEILPETGYRLRDISNAAPQVERLIRRLGMFLTLIGFATLLIGGVGIANAVKGHLDTKIESIAALKAMGADAGFVFRIHLCVVALYGVVGILIGLAGGAALAKFGGDILAARFSLPLPDIMDISSLLLAAAYGILMVLCFSLWPLGRAVAAKPSDLFRGNLLPDLGKPKRSIRLWIALLAIMLATLAVTTSFVPRIAAGFVAGAIATVFLFSLCARAVESALRNVAHWKNPFLRLAARNISRPGNATTGVILSLGLGLSVLVTVTGIQYSFSHMLKEDLAADTPSFFFLDIRPDQRDAFAKTVTSEPSARNLTLAPSLRGRITKVNDIPAEHALVDRNEDWLVRSDRAFTSVRDMPKQSTLTEGVWWPADYNGPAAVSIATNVARAFDIGVGDRLTVNVLGLTITATVMNVRDINWMSGAMNFAVTFAPGPLDGAPANLLATVGIDADREEALQAQLIRDFPNVTAVRVRDAVETAKDLLRTTALAVSAAASVTIFSGILVLAGAVAAARRRHQRDAIILKVLGADRRHILTGFLIEYGGLGLITAVIALVVGNIGSYAVLRFVMELPWSFGWLPMAGILGASLFLTLLAGFIGTWHILGRKPAFYLRNN